MQYIDIIIAIPLLWGAFMGFRKGLVLELASLVGLILGLYGALKFSHLTGEFLSDKIEISAQWMGFVSFLLTFILIVLGVFLLAKIIDRVLKISALGLINRILGLVFGILKYALIVSMLLYFYEGLNKRFKFNHKKVEEESILYSPLKTLSLPFQSLLDEFDTDRLPNLMDEEKSELNPE
jgi:membrane protein required for colicin V production